MLHCRQKKFPREPASSLIIVSNLTVLHQWRYQCRLTPHEHCLARFIYLNIKCWVIYIYTAYRYRDSTSPVGNNFCLVASGIRTRVIAVVTEPPTLYATLSTKKVSAGTSFLPYYCFEPYGPSSVEIPVPANAAWTLFSTIYIFEH